jgi:hypothetical protein
MYFYILARYANYKTSMWLIRISEYCYWAACWWCFHSRSHPWSGSYTVREPSMSARNTTCSWINSTLPTGLCEHLSTDRRRIACTVYSISERPLCKERAYCRRRRTYPNEQVLRKFLPRGPGQSSVDTSISPSMGKRTGRDRNLRNGDQSHRAQSIRLRTTRRWR